MKKRLARWGIVLLIVYLTVGLLLYLLQEQFLFHPVSLSAEHRFQFSNPYKEYNISNGKENWNILYFPAQKKRKGTVLFFHGNMKHMEHYARYPDLFLRNGYDVWTVDYPGFGKSTGKRSEQLLYKQALLLYQMVIKKTPADSILLYGKSIGTGIAAYLASTAKAKRLILETPYFSIPALAKTYVPIYPVSSLSRYTLPVHKYLRQADMPVSVFHGTEDEIIPYKQSLMLKKEHPKMELISIEKGKHNNLYDFELFQKKIDSLMQ